MKAVTHNLQYYGKDDLITLYPLGDVHLGARACNEAQFERAVAEVAEDPAAYWIGLGDFCDCINRRDPRFRLSEEAAWLHDEKTYGPEDLDSPVQLQTTRFLEMVAPIRHKCLALVKGNHEDAQKRYTEHDPYKEICNGILPDIPEGQCEGHPALGVCGYVRLRFRFQSSRGTDGMGWTFTIWTHHGYSGGKLAGGKALDLERQLTSHEADVVLMGHTHARQYVSRSVDKLTAQGYIEVVERKGAFCGSFHNDSDGVETYAERKGYPPLQTGFVKVRVWPGRRRFTIEL